MRRRTVLPLLWLGFALALAVGLARLARPAVPTYPCGGQALTAAELAARRGLTPDEWRALQRAGDLSPEALCTLSDEALEEAVGEAAHAKPDHPGEAVTFRNLQLQDENGQIPPDALPRAAKQLAQMRLAQQANPPPAAGLASGGWQWLGPGNIGGRVRALVVHPTDPNRMWVGSVGGGIWATTNAGTTWAPVDDFMANLAVATLAMHPADPTTLYAGTGEGFYNSDGLRGAGVFKSVDAGVHWAQLPATNTSSWYYVNRLAIHPAVTQTLLAATGSGLWRTVDGGTNWTQVSAAALGILDVDFDPTNGNRAVAGGWSAQAWYSVDGGQTWNSATGLPTAGAAWSARVELAYAPSSPGTVYASVNVNSGEIWKSIDGGQSYTRVSTGFNYLGSQGWYDNIIWVDPANANLVVVGGIDLWRSVNGGGTLTQISQWQQAPASAHADNHAIVPVLGYGAANHTLLIGNDGGLYRANDITASPVVWQALNNTFGVTQFYGAAGNAATGVIVGGTQDNGTLRYSGNPEGWTAMFGGDGGFSAADPTDSNYFYGEYVYLQIHRSTDGGVSAGYIDTGLTDATNPTPCANFIAPFILDPNNPNTLLGGGCSLWRSVNAKAPAPTWAVIRSGTSGNPISAIAVAPGHSNLIWVGYNNGDVYTTTTGTSATPTWTQVDTNGVGLPGRYVARITLDPADANRAFVTFGGFSAGNVWGTPDGGLTWTNLSGTGGTALPSAPVRSLVLNPNVPNWLYAGTEVGVFTSEDGGATWHLPQDGPANVSVDELFWLDANTLVAVTHGRGLYLTRLGIALKGAGVAWTETAGNNNGAADPGEVLAVQVGVKNLGLQTATGVSGALAVVGGGATVLTATAAYPDIAASATQTNTTPFALSIDPNQPCGQSVSLALTVTSNSGQTYIYPFSIPVGQARAGVLLAYPYPGPALPIDPNLPNTVTATVNVPTSGGVAEVQAQVNISHTYDGDLHLALISPSGTSVALSTGNGGSGQNYTDTLFNDLAAQSIVNGVAPFTGAYRPQSPLGALAGQPSAGDWKLRVEDVSALDGGSLNAFVLYLRANTYVCNPLPTVQWAADHLSVDEAAGSATFTVTLTPTSTRVVSVTYATADGTATAGRDYVPISGTLVFAPGQSAQTVTVEIVDDALSEAQETFSLNLTGSVNANLGTPAATLVTLVDNDPLPTVQFSSATQSVDETAGQVTLTVTLSAASGQAVSVGYTTASDAAGGNPAVPGKDYVATSGTLVFAPGETTHVVTVPLLDDALYEAAEVLSVNLSGPVNALLGGPAIAVVTILENDPLPRVSFGAAEYSVNENAGTAALPVTLTNASAYTVTVAYATRDGTALAGRDYLAASGTLVFAPGQTARPLTLTVRADRLFGPPKYLRLTLSQPANAALGTYATAQVNLLETDSPTVYLPIIQE